MDLLFILGALAVVWLLGQSQSAAGASSTDTADYGVSSGLDSISQAVARMEGFFVSGSKPQRTNNPGDIGTWNGQISSYPTADDGWAALKNWITSHASANPDWDFYDMFAYYLNGDTLNTSQSANGYAEYVASQAGVYPTTSVYSVIQG